MNGLNGFSFVSSSSDINAVANQNAYEAWSNGKLNKTVTGECLITGRHRLRLV